MPRRNVFEVVEGDTLPTIAITWSNKDVTGFTITLQVQQEEDASPLEKTATITDATNGEFYFAFLTSDLLPGLHPARIKTDDGAGGVETFRGFFVKVPENWT